MFFGIFNGFLLINLVFSWIREAHKFAQAIDLYTQAIDLNGDNAVYWANRALAHTKLEEYGSAIIDATKAVEIDPKYSKARILAKTIWSLLLSLALSLSLGYWGGVCKVVLIGFGRGTIDEVRLIWQWRSLKKHSRIFSRSDYIPLYFGYIRLSEASFNCLFCKVWVFSSLR